MTFILNQRAARLKGAFDVLVVNRASGARQLGSDPGRHPRRGAREALETAIP